MHAVRRTAAALALTLLAAVPSVSVAGCRGAHDRTADAAADSAEGTGSAAAAAAPAAPASKPAPAADANAPLTVSDIDRWERGMAAELEAVRAAAAQRARATTATDSTTATFAADETQTRAAGARAAGVDESRYQQIRTTLASLAGYMTPIEQSMDVKSLPASAVAQMRQSQEADLAQASRSVPPDVVAALRPRAAALNARSQALAAERLRVAGMGH